MTQDKKNLNNYILNVFNTNKIQKLIAKKSPFHTGNNIYFNFHPINNINISIIQNNELNIFQDSHQSSFKNFIFDSKINKTENEEEALKIEINEIEKNQNKTIIILKNKLKKAYEIIENQSIIINDLKNKLNISNDKINYYKNEINNLENNIKKKEKELNDYKSYLESELNNINKTTKVDVKDIMAVNFISSDGNIHKAIPCVPNNTFAEIEEKLYQFFPEYRKFNNTFLAHGSPVLRFKTISENKIGDGFPVTLIFE